jgi:polyhydroxyalkanoate synthesis repressor PhaR
MSDASKQSVTIKKYANRRLYNTATSSYVTLEDLSKMVKEGIEFNVYDAKTSEDLTRSVLTQIIVEEEGKAGQNLLPISFLRQLIGFYGDNMQWLVPKYLEHSMQALSRNQDQIRGYFKTAFSNTPFGSMFPFGTTLEEMSKQNMSMFERAMRMFAPFGNMTEGGATINEPAAPTSAEEMAEVVAAAQTNVTAMPIPATQQASTQAGASGEDVQGKIAALQRQLADLAKNKA